MGNENQESKGLLAIVITIIVLILIGGLFVINAKKSRPDEVMMPTDQTTFPEEVISTSTKIDDISTDISDVETSVNNSGLDQLDKELNSL